MSAKTTAAPVNETKKAQWNTRVHPNYRRCAKIVSAMTDYSQDELALLGLASLFGVDTKDVAQCRSRVQEAAKRSGILLPTEPFTTFTR